MSKFETRAHSKMLLPLAEKLAGRKIQEQLALIENWSQGTPTERKQRMARALADTVQYAGEHVPYYRDLFRRINFNPERLKRDMAWLNDVPYLTKEIVMMQPERFISDEYQRDSLLERKTSGSTGLTLSFLYSREELDMASAVLRHLDHAAGKNPGDREAHLRLVPPHDQNSFKDDIIEILKAVALNRKTISLNTLSVDSAIQSLNALAKRKSHALFALRSTIESILRLADDGNRSKEICKVYVSTGETLDAQSADYIQSKLGCLIFNRYGNAEFGAVAQSESDPQNMRFVDGLVWPEKFTVEGFSEVVLTGLTKRAMPLIRYRTGDLGVVTTGEDGSFWLSSVTGRLHDIIDVGPSKYTTAYFSEFLHKRFSLHDFQIIEAEGPRPLEFRIVTDQPEQIPSIEADLNQLLDQSVKVVRIRLSDLIRRGRQMKFAHVVRGAKL